MNRFILAFALTFGAAGIASAQNTSTVTQSGSSQDAVVTQQGGTNTANVNQSNSDNFAAIEQGVRGGTSSATATINQAGADNDGPPVNPVTGTNDGAYINQGTDGGAAGGGTNATINQDGTGDAADIIQGYYVAGSVTNGSATVTQTGASSNNQTRVYQGIAGRSTNDQATVSQGTLGSVTNSVVIVNQAFGNTNTSLGNRATVTQEFGTGALGKILQGTSRLSVGGSDATNNVATATMDGDRNQVEIDQGTDGSDASGNTAAVDQFGSDNITQVNQGGRGQGNATNGSVRLDQSGNLNTALINQSNLNALGVTADGNVVGGTSAANAFDQRDGSSLTVNQETDDNTVLGRQVGSSANVRQGNHGSMSAGGNLTVLDQENGGNAVVYQQSTDGSTPPASNDVTIYQRGGANNDAYVFQSGGTGLSVDLSQTGGSSGAHIVQAGVDVDAEVDQIGEGNIVHTYSQGDNSAGVPGFVTELDIEQIGDLNRVVMEQRQSGGVGSARAGFVSTAFISQTGTGNRVGGPVHDGVNDFFQTRSDLRAIQNGTNNVINGQQTGSTAIVDQFGGGAGANGNTVNLNQTNAPGVINAYYAADVQQNGQSHMATVTQTGDNRTTVDQVGFDHTATVTQTDSLNVATVDQMGSGNSVIVTQN